MLLLKASKTKTKKQLLNENNWLLAQICILIISIFTNGTKRHDYAHLSKCSMTDFNYFSLQALFVWSFSFQMLSSVAKFNLFKIIYQGLNYKMLRRNHPKYYLTIISQICVCVINRMNIRTKNAQTPLSNVKSMNRERSWTYVVQLNGFSSPPCKQLLINVFSI